VVGEASMNLDGVWDFFAASTLTCSIYWLGCIDNDFGIWDIPTGEYKSIYVPTRESKDGCICFSFFFYAVGGRPNDV
jgi:hypothetical protein